MTPAPCVACVIVISVVAWTLVALAVWLVARAVLA